MNGRFDFRVFAQTAKPAKPCRQAANWLRVNIGAAEAKRLRALAECMGFNFRDFLEAAVRAHGREYEMELERENGVKIEDVLQMSRARRREIGRKRQELRRGCLHYGVCCADKN